MILLMGFKAFEDFDTEYQLTETDALRIAQLVGHPGQPSVVYVTFLHKDLTNDQLEENLRRGRAIASSAADSLDLFD